MSNLFGRSYRFTIDDIQTEGGGLASGIDIQFRVSRTSKSEPNTAQISLYNLSGDTRQSLEKRHKEGQDKRTPIICKLEAGYGSDIGIIFHGDVVNLRSKHDGSDWITTVEASDGGHAVKAAEVSKSFAKGTSVKAVVEAIVTALGIGKGNLSDMAGRLKTATGTTYPHGTAIHGNAERALDNVLRSCGLDWSIQGGALQLQERGKPYDQEVYSLGPDSGLIGSPEPYIEASVLGKDGKPRPAKSGGVKFRSLLIHQLKPGGQVALESDAVNGQYHLTQLEFLGSTFGQEWYCDHVARPING